MLGNNIVSKSSSPRKTTPLITTLFWLVALAIIALAVGSFVLSFNALRELAQTEGGIDSRLAWIWPLIVDLSLVIYTATILTSQLNKWPVWFPVSLVLFYAVVTIGGNIAHAPPTPLGWFIAALAPVSLVLASEALRVLIKHDADRRGTLSSLAEITAERESIQAELESVTAQVSRLTSQRDKLKDQIAESKREYVTVGSDTKQQAQAILATRPDISGAELGRKLGKSESLGRKLKKELAESIPVNGNGATQ